jgi:peptide/nickel transport system ATP-binding protein
MQMVFQDPTNSPNSRFTGARHRRPDHTPRRHQRQRRGARAVRIWRAGGVAGRAARPFLHRLSSGQKARVGIARAIALKPGLVILDEPPRSTFPVQAVVLNLLQELKKELGMSYLFVSRGPDVARLLCDRVIVMRRLDRGGGADGVLFALAADEARELLAAIHHFPM